MLFRKLASTLFLTLGAAGFASIAACSVITGSDIGLGLGQPCETDDECQASKCIENVCTRECAEDADCPEGSACLDTLVCSQGPAPSVPVGQACTASTECLTGTCGSDGLCTKPCEATTECPAPSECFAGFCQIPLDVGFIWVGVVEDQGWTKTHDIGREYALEQLPYLRADFVTNVFKDPEATDALNAFVEDGKDVIVANSFSLRNQTSGVADSNPDTQFLVCAGNVTKDNLGTYFARSYQAWYLAGYTAASKSQTGRLGFVGSYVTPELVRHIDAFTLGAKRADPSVKVEVRWEGFWFDVDPPNADQEYRETVLANELIETGCDVIAHGSDNGRVVEAVEKAHDMGDDVWSIGNDNIDACKLGPSSCIGVPYWNWGPLYVRIFDQIHRGTWDPKVPINDNILVNLDESIVSFGATEDLLSNDLKISLGELRADLASDPKLAFRGPYDVNANQRSQGDVTNGEEISDEELATMCWFVEGVIEKEDPLDPLSADVPARVPWGDVQIPPGSGNTPDCRVNQ
ncbi:MAG: BMP family ABC transporter substrate-binding protein [Polyangiaceae bacterium]|nr:BMP family ABC transporter substrate-binding protein [Polyangiaceae bacterium]